MGFCLGIRISGGERKSRKRVAIHTGKASIYRDLKFFNWLDSDPGKRGIIDLDQSVRIEHEVSAGCAAIIELCV